MKHKILKYDKWLKPYEKDLDLRQDRYQAKRAQILPESGRLSDFANAHRYFGFHKTESGWFYREWAPGAETMYLTGDFCGWDRHAHPMTKLKNGVFELFLPGTDTLKDGMGVMTVVVHDGKELERIPL